MPLEMFYLNAKVIQSTYLVFDLFLIVVITTLSHCTQVVELKPGGADISVTRTNSIEYLHLVAHYKLNLQIEKQFLAFRKGLSEILPLHWLRLFSQNEFQVLISGAEMPINVPDLRKNTAYSGNCGKVYICMYVYVHVCSAVQYV